MKKRFFSLLYLLIVIFYLELEARLERLSREWEAFRVLFLDLLFMGDKRKNEFFFQRYKFLSIKLIINTGVLN